jgi:hypothetical protein
MVWDSDDNLLTVGDGSSRKVMVDTTTAQTLTNKTISGASNTISNVSLTSGVTGVLPIANGGTNASTAADARTSLGLGTVAVEDTVPVSKGGTGATSLTANNVILGNGTSAVQVVAPGTSGNVLVSNGTTWESAAPSAAGINTQTFDASGTWTKPAGYAAGSRVYIQAWGAGGSGSRHSTAATAGGGGGGGYNERWLLLSNFGATETITIGAGGAARTGSNLAGAQGGNSTAGSLLTGFGGSGGTSPGDASIFGNGGGQLSAGSANTPGLPNIMAAIKTAGSSDTPIVFYIGGGFGNRSNIENSASASLGPFAAFNHGGGGGSNTTPSSIGAASVWGGGGGGGASSSSAGGTSSFGGNGGAGGATGVAGSQPGGGGGGGTTTSGAGGAGRVIITVFPA